MYVPFEDWLTHRSPDNKRRGEKVHTKSVMTSWYAVAIGKDKSTIASMMICSSSDASSEVRRIVDEDDSLCNIGLATSLPDCYNEQ